MRVQMVMKAKHIVEGDHLLGAKGIFYVVTNVGLHDRFDMTQLQIAGYGSAHIEVPMNTKLIILRSI